jgi:hypothetical protein
MIVPAVISMPEPIARTSAATTTMTILATTPSPNSVAETGHPGLTKTCR